MDARHDTHGREQAAQRNAALVERAQAGDERAFGELYDEWFARVHDTACRITGDRSIGAEVTQDVFLRAWRSLDTLRDPLVFGGWLLRITRNAALNRRRSEHRTSAVDDEGLAVIEAHAAGSGRVPGVRVEERVAAASDPVEAVADAEVVALVWEVVGALPARDAEVLDLGLRQGLSPAEIGEAVGLNRNAANQAVHRARQRFRMAMEARVLWRGREPECPQLARELRAAGVEHFGAAAVPVADAHARHCDRCGDRRRLRLEPAALFGATPLVMVPVLLKAKVAAALAADGVPMGGSRSPSGSGPEGGAGSGSSPGAHAGVPHAPLVSGGEESTARRSRRRVGAAVAAAAVLLVLALAVATLARNDGERTVAAGGTAAPTTSARAATTTSTTTSTTTLVPSTTSAAPAAAPPATSSPPVAAPPPATDPPAEPAAPAPTDPPPTTSTSTSTTTTTVPVDASLTIVPSTRARPWTIVAADAPRITWTVTGAASVQVRGPGVAASTASGSEILCIAPPPPTSTCNPPLGPHTYTLVARDAAGTVVAERTAVLTVT
jgi:RNA polymerase sigma factor (sigma-70 family)